MPLLHFYDKSAQFCYFLSKSRRSEKGTKSGQLFRDPPTVFYNSHSMVRLTSATLQNSVAQIRPQQRMKTGIVFFMTWSRAHRHFRVSGKNMISRLTSVGTGGGNPRQKKTRETLALCMKSGTQQILWVTVAIEGHVEPSPKLVYSPTILDLA
jgi:hypothetical protein